MLSAAADPRLAAGRNKGTLPCRPFCPEEGAGNEIWGWREGWEKTAFGVLFVGVESEAILNLLIDCSTLLAICYKLVVEDGFARMIGLLFRELRYPVLLTTHS